MKATTKKQKVNNINERWNLFDWSSTFDSDLRTLFSPALDYEDDLHVNRASLLPCLGRVTNDTAGLHCYSEGIGFFLTVSKGVWISTCSWVGATDFTIIIRSVLLFVAMGVGIWWWCCSAAMAVLLDFVFLRLQSFVLRASTQKPFCRVEIRRELVLPRSPVDPGTVTRQPAGGEGAWGASLPNPGDPGKDSS